MARRCALAGVLLALPMTLLIAVTVIVIQREESDLGATVDEAVNALVPLTSLEYNLQRALTDELQAQTGTSVPDYGGLTQAIDREFSQLGMSTRKPDVPTASIEEAQKAWKSARPSVERLVEHATPLPLKGADRSNRLARDELRQAIADIEQARTRLARVVKARATATATEQRRELRTLLLAWIATLAVAAVMVGAVVLSIVRPARELGHAVQQLGAGDLSIRVDDTAQDELGGIASYLNALAERFAARRSTLESEALEDTLTRLPNRRSILRALDVAMDSARETGRPPSLLLIDVDRFKQLNDRFGHAVGDRALSWLAEAMKSRLRAGDVLGRYAGDEFLAVLPTTSAEDARMTAERLCASVKELRGSDPALPTITIGVATASAAGETAEQLIEAADRALYRGKNGGRARIAVA